MGKMSGFGKASGVLLLLLLIVSVIVLNTMFENSKSKNVSSPQTSPTGESFGGQSPLSSSPSAVPATSTTMAGQQEKNNGRSKEQFSLPSCGDGSCDADETCSSCKSDCGCSLTEYCSEVGSCYPKEFYGDGTCTEKEKTSGNDCSDCGCTAGKVCDYQTNTCLNTAGLSQSQIAAISASFMANSSVNYTSWGYNDEVLEGRPVVVIFLYCPSINGTVCQTVLYVDAQGKILMEGQAT